VRACLYVYGGFEFFFELEFNCLHHGFQAAAAVEVKGDLECSRYEDIVAAGVQEYNFAFQGAGWAEAFV
jgi:hypothetical protein